MKRLSSLLFFMRARRGPKYVLPGLLLCVAFMFTQCEEKEPDPVPSSDKTPPKLSAASFTRTASKDTLKLTSDEAGKLYWVVLADGAAKPAADKVKAPSSLSPAPVAKGSKALIKGANTIPITGLDASTDYELYYVAEDKASPPNLGNVGTQEVAAAGGAMEPSISAFSVAAAAGGKMAISLNSDQAGTVYWVAWNQDASATGTVPADAADVAGATQGDTGETAIPAVPTGGAADNAHYSGNVALATMGSAATVETDALFDGDSYILYVVVQNAAGDNSALQTATAAVEADNTAPSGITVTVASSTAGMLDVSLGAAATEELTVYWVALSSAETLTAAQVMAGQDSSDMDVATSGNVMFASGEGTTAKMTALVAGTYEVYVVVTDAVGNAQAGAPIHAHITVN